MDLRAINYEQSIRAGSSTIAEDYYPYPLSSLSLKTIPTPYPLFLNYSSGSITLKLLLLETPPPFPVSEDYSLLLTPYHWTTPLGLRLKLLLPPIHPFSEDYSPPIPSSWRQLCPTLFLKTIPSHPSHSILYLKMIPLYIICFWRLLPNQ